MRGMNQGIEEDRTALFQQVNSLNRAILNGYGSNAWTTPSSGSELRIGFMPCIIKGGLLTPDAVHAVVQRRAQEIESAVIAESARWGDTGRGGGEPRTAMNTGGRKWIGFSMNTFLAAVTSLSQLFRQGLVPDFSPAACERRADDWHLSAERGQIFVTLDGSDPRAIGGKPSEKARVVSMPIPVKEGKNCEPVFTFRASGVS